jgi:hypothetical protein
LSMTFPAPLVALVPSSGVRLIARRRKDGGGVAVVKQLQRFAIWQLRAGPLRNGDKVLYASVSRFGEWNWSWSGRRLSRRCGSDKATFLEDLPFA